MKKYTVAIAICLIALMATMTFAGAVNVALCPDAAPDDARGRAILNYAKGADKTEIQVNCWGLDPDYNYTAWINVTGLGCPEIGGWSNIGTFSVNTKGNGHVHASVPTDVSGAVLMVNFETPSATHVLEPCS